MANPVSLYDKYPDYRVDLEPNADRVQVSLGGEVIADSQRTVIVRETNHSPVIYFPKDDVRMDLFEPTELTTVCPFKGEASYWTVKADGRVEENLVWAYEEPFDEVSDLAGFMSFYPDRVTWDPPQS